jgi:hypothetical protein
MEEHLGSEFTKRVILTRDKTLVRGDVLIDKKPTIGGISTPQWRHAKDADRHKQETKGIEQLTIRSFQSLRFCPDRAPFSRRSAVPRLVATPCAGLALAHSNEG